MPTAWFRPTRLSRLSRRSGGKAGTAARAVGLVLTAWVLAACADLGPVRDFGRVAAGVALYPQAGATYVDSAVSSAPFIDATADTLVDKAHRQAQVGDAVALQAALSGYFATLARLAGDEEFDLATAKSMWTEARTLGGGNFDKTTVDAYAGLTRQLAGFAEVPARERAVRALVQDGGPSAMRILAGLRNVLADWRAQVTNDAKLVDATLGVATLPADVAPLLRILATDRRAQLARDYAVSLRRLRSADEALEKVATAHAELVGHLDDLQGEAVRRRLRQATAELRAARVVLASAL